ncbi:MAG: TonB-linked SusC/RagA family outer membrane protein [Roseivirga sp.]|jgi:TonB-linked SusC/RagA family outer membrane protein
MLNFYFGVKVHYGIIIYLLNKTNMKKILLSCFMLLLMISSIALQAQERTISGKVIGADDGLPLPLVSVFLKGTSTGVPTDSDGNYRLNIPQSGGILVFKFLSFTTQEVAIGTQTVINITLQTEITALGEVVVVGYGTQSEKLTLQSVSNISAKNLNNLPVLSAQEALQGQAAGVNVVTSSGIAGASSRVNVRGIASLGNGATQPLYVIDGVPLNDVIRSGGQGGTGLNPIADINPNEIESMTVLKDASAVSIYGSRGANGVILITTKKGTAGKTKINFNYQTGINEETYRLDMMSGQEFETFRNELRAARGQSIVTPTNQSFDWVDAIHRQGRSDSYSLSARGGDKTTSFYISANYIDQTTFMVGNDIDRLNARINLTHKISDKVKFGTNIGIARTINNRIGAENSTFAPFTGSALQNPTVLAFDSEGNYTRTGFIPNLVALEEIALNELKTRRLTGNIFVEAELFSGLIVKTDLGIDQLQNEQQQRFPDLINPGGTAFKSIAQDLKYLTTTTARYEKEFGKSIISLLGGISYEVRENENISVAGSDFVADALPNVGSAATPTTTNASGGDWAIYSVFSRAGYNYDNKYLFEANFRRDGSSRFGSNFRFGNFWSVSAGWRLSEESFIKSLNFFDDLKLKASYGIAGNDQIGLFPSIGLYGGSDYAGIPGIIPTQAANPNITWEETAQLDITLNAAFFDSKVNVEVSYYDKRTDGLLNPIQIPWTTGFTSFNGNLGEVQNRGVDLSISTINFSSGDFRWETTLNLGFLENTVLSLPEENLDDQDRVFTPISENQRAIVGESINTFYLIPYIGVNAETGEAEWLDIDGVATNTPTAADRRVVGSAVPTLTGGFRNSFRYKNFDMNAFFSFATGHQIQYDGLRFTENPGGGFNKARDILNYWRQPGDNAALPRLDGTTVLSSNQRSTKQLRDGDFIRLRNLNIGYTLPEAITSQVPNLGSVRIFAQGQNLWISSKAEIEPEFGGFPLGESFFPTAQARTYTIGIDINF